MSASRKKKRALRPLSDDCGDVFSRILKTCGLTEQAYHLKVCLTWDEAVGPNIAKRTQVQSFSRGVLVVKAASPTWQNELYYLRATIIQKMNRLLAKPLITNLKVISGHLPRPQNTSKASLFEPSPTALDYSVAQDTSLPIADAEVRAAFERLMAKDRYFKHNGSRTKATPTRIGDD